MHYIYILYSEISDLYYVGYTNDPRRRLEEHNTTPFNTFTSKHRPWILKAIFECGNSENNAIQLERFIKNQKKQKANRAINKSSIYPFGNFGSVD